MCILDGNAYDAKCLEAGQERDEDLDACSLLVNNKMQPLLSPSGAASHNPQSKVVVQLTVQFSSSSTELTFSPPISSLSSGIYLPGIILRISVSKEICFKQSRVYSPFSQFIVCTFFRKLLHAQVATVDSLSCK